MDHRSNQVIFDTGSFVSTDKLRIDPFAQTLHYGYGVVEGIRVYDTPEGPRMFKANEHIDRLLNSGKRLHLELPYTTTELVAIAEQLLEKNQLKDAYIRPLLYTGANMSLLPSQEPRLLIAALKWERKWANHSIKIKRSSYQRPQDASIPVGIKACGLYTSAVLALAEARSEGYQDALMLNQEGQVLGTTGSNIFLEKNEVLYTPPATQVIAGITRATVLEMAAEIGIPVVEKPLTPDEVIRADAAFITGTTTEITGIASLDQHRYLLRWPDTLGYVLSRTYHQRVTRAELHSSTLI